MNASNRKLVLYYPNGHEKHAEAGHPERPERVEVLRAALQQAGFWDEAGRLPAADLPQDVLEGVHSRLMLQAIQDAARSGRRLDMDTYTTPASWDVARATAGGALAVAQAVWKREAQRGFALTRPPGHHATSQRPMGFCLLNNVALAAQDLLAHHAAQRLAIVDLDLHHGNGTQDIFWERGEVFYISTHQSPLYPGSGSLEETGAGPGAGTTANFPLPPGSGDRAFASILQDLVLPLLERHASEMLLVSFGFDPHWRDPLGHLQLSADGYAALVAALAGWADGHCEGRIALFLEGGYDLDAAAACGRAVTAALLGETWTDALGPSPRPEGQSWQAVYRRGRDLWGV